MTTTADFQVSIAVALSPAEAFDKVCSVSAWWTTDIEGQTRGANSNFTVRFEDTYVDFNITEFVPGKAVSWHVTNCYIPWFEDKTEWTGTTVRFDISPTDSGSKVTLTHVGLKPELECFEGCSAGWQHHISDSLQKLISEGTGIPKGRSLHVTLNVPTTAAEVFEAICRVPDWWSTEFEGETRSKGDVFKVRFAGRHMTEFRIADMSLGQRIVWEVTDSHLDWLDDPTEWMGTKIIWVIQEHGGPAQLTMTHKGLEPEKECYSSCEKGWEYFVTQSLARLITEGKGRPGLPVTQGDTNE
ncbi:MAG: SRPBCC family protein [Fimbriimonas sp.]|nr:SRPBCC family protein [Fimbriimonas sp.]